MDPRIIHRLLYLATQTSDASLGKHKNSEDDDDDPQDRDRLSRRKRTRVTTESICAVDSSLRSIT
jgi:hypothetical protein